MTSGVKPIPEGYHSITPYLVVNDAAGAIEFYRSAFGASELMRMAAAGGRVGHAEIGIGDSRIMLADEFPEMGARSARTLGGSPVHIYLYVEDVDAYLYVEDVDAVTGKALAAGAKELRPVKDQFYGDRSGSIEDPFGHVWHVSTHKEDVPADELKRRADRAMRQSGS
jgi:PhnB protein